MASLPIPNAQAQAHSQQIAQLIQQKIQQAGGWISFADFMQLALYTPALGYYSGGGKKFGVGGDFVTAPEISPLFAQTVANQIVQILQITQGNILELGAGTGKLAVDSLLTLAELDCLPGNYFILEVSDHLRQVQLENLQKKLTPDLFQRVEWLKTLPTTFAGVVIGNEVLDAIPAHIVHVASQALCERGVSFDDGFLWHDQPITNKNLLEIVTQQNLPLHYISEFCPAASGLVASLASMLQSGVILMIDYGFSAREYYHPQRNLGTLMCHYQHYAHTNPLINVGLQDITAHVNFSQIALAGESHGISLSGYASQAQFLMNCGILNIMSQVSPHDMACYAPLAAAAQKLLSPAEMGDLFKVIALSKNIDEPLIGFASGDKSHTL